MGRRSLPEHERPHGTDGCYRNHRCRRPECVAAHRQKVAAERARRRGLPIPAHVPHGSASTYQNWGCRCTPCTEDEAAAMADWRRRRG